MSLVTIVILFVVGIVGYRVASSLGSAVEYSEKNTLPAVEAIASMRLTFLEIRVAVLGHMTTWDDNEKKDYDKRISENRESILTAAQTLDIHVEQPPWHLPARGSSRARKIRTTQHPIRLFRFLRQRAPAFSWH